MSRQQLRDAIVEAMIAVPRPKPYADGSSDRSVIALAEAALDAIANKGALILMPVEVNEIPDGATVHLSPPTISLNWPEGAYRPFVNGNSRVFVNVLRERR